MKMKERRRVEIVGLCFLQSVYRVRRVDCISKDRIKNVVRMFSVRKRLIEGVLR